MKHIEIAKAWLDGKRVQVHNGSAWIELTSVEKSTEMPRFFSISAYRIAPEKKKFRVFEITSGNLHTAIAGSYQHAEHLSCFKRWVTEEIEYEAV